MAKKMSLGIKVAWLGVAGIIAGAIIAGIFSLFSNSAPTTAIDGNQFSGPAAITTGSNSPATVFSATTSGSNSPINQTVNNINFPTNEIGDIRERQRQQEARQDKQDEKQDEILAILRRMEGFREEKKQDPDFQAIFPTGYILFTATATATGRKEIIPSHPSPLDQIQFDWTKGYSIEMSPTNSLIRLPPFIVKRGSSTGHFSVGAFGLPRSPGQATTPMRFGDDELTFLVVSTNANETMVAVGLRPARLRPGNVTK